MHAHKVQLIPPIRSTVMPGTKFGFTNTYIHTYIHTYMFLNLLFWQHTELQAIIGIKKVSKKWRRGFVRTCLRFLNPFEWKSYLLIFLKYYKFIFYAFLRIISVFSLHNHMWIIRVLYFSWPIAGDQTISSMIFPVKVHIKKVRESQY